MKIKVDSGNGRLKTDATPKQDKWKDPIYAGKHEYRRNRNVLKPSVIQDVSSALKPGKNTSVKSILKTAGSTFLKIKSYKRRRV